jgi:hypothetical protein
VSIDRTVGASPADSHAAQITLRCNRNRNCFHPMHAPICRPRPKGSIPYVRRRIDSLNLGAALEQTAAPVNRINRGYLQGQWQTLAGLAVYFSAMLSGIVVDRTGISGAFTLSHDTALRDIHDLTDQGILTKDPAGGRSTSYSLKATYNPLAFRLLK